MRPRVLLRLGLAASQGTLFHILSCKRGKWPERTLLWQRPVVCVGV